jgi:hypothetical protein
MCLFKYICISPAMETISHLQIDFKHSLFEAATFQLRGWLLKLAKYRVLDIDDSVISLGSLVWG